MHPCNPFRNETMQKHWEELVAAYERRSPVLFNVDGSFNRGCSPAGYFWQGFESMSGAPRPIWDRASKEMAAYAQYRAGQYCALYFSIYPRTN